MNDVNMLVQNVPRILLAVVIVAVAVRIAMYIGKRVVNYVIGAVTSFTVFGLLTGRLSLDQVLYYIKLVWFHIVTFFQNL